MRWFRREREIFFLRDVIPFTSHSWMLSVGFHLTHTCRIVTHVEIVPGSTTTDGQKRHFNSNFSSSSHKIEQELKLLQRPSELCLPSSLRRETGEETKGSTERMGRIIDFLPSSTGILAPAASSKFKSSSNSSSRHDVHGREDRIYPVTHCYSKTHHRYHQSRHFSPSEGSESSFDVRELDAALKAEYHPQHECPARSPSSSNEPKTRRKHVRFDTVSDSNTIPIARRKDIPKSERKELWYTRSDYRRIREEHKEMCLKQQQQQQQQQQTFISYGQPENPNESIDELELAVLQELMHHNRYHPDAYARQRRELHRSMATGVVLRQNNNNAQQLASQYIDIVRRTRHACFVSSLIAQTHRSIRGGDSSRAALIIN